ncbi:MAG: F0F1 ATP synthase subunit A [Candidatus Glassbacteria bacterium]|nr:F0F1 ATP synthase subunit A [Candidatus Glassbacteria bacterium]
MAQQLYAADPHAAAETASHGEEAGEIMRHLIEHGYDTYVLKIDWRPFGLEWLDLSITKVTVNMWLVAALIFLSFRLLVRKQAGGNRSGRYLNFLEPFVIYVRSQMVYPIMGEANGRRYLPFFLTQFFFVLFCNLMGLIPIPNFELAGVAFPGLATATANMAVCAALSGITLFTIFIMGMTEQGPLKFWKNMVPHGVPAPLLPLLFPIEVIGIFIKCFALTIRLFANMTAGHIVILTFIGLIFIFHSVFVAPASIAFALFIYMLEIFVAFLQAFIFTLLSIIFINMAIHPEH